MNKNGQDKKSIFRWKEKYKDVALVSCLACLLFLVVFQVFGVGDNNTTQGGVNSEKELRIERLLERMEGVGDAEVVICETEEGVESVVVLCEGAADFQVVLSVREAVASALGMQQKNVKIYLKKE